MFGGRTQVFRMLPTLAEDEMYDYQDFCSLYPYVNAVAAEYPKGQPTILTDGFEKFQTNKPISYKGMYRIIFKM